MTVFFKPMTWRRDFMLDIQSWNSWDQRNVTIVKLYMWMIFQQKICLQIIDVVRTYSRIQIILTPLTLRLVFVIPLLLKQWQLRTLEVIYSSALDLQVEIDAVSSMSWPPSSIHLTLEATETLLPVKLFNFLSWVTGMSSEPEDEKFVKVTDDQKWRLLSLAQDVTYLVSKGRKPMPEQTPLAMAVKHLTSSGQLIGLLNGFGHSTSHTAVLEHYTVLAKKEIQNRDAMLPSSLQKDIFTTVVRDINDFGEETSPEETQPITPTEQLSAWTSRCWKTYKTSQKHEKQTRERSLMPLFLR